MKILRWVLLSVVVSLREEMQRLTLLSFSLKNDWEKSWDRTAVPRSRNPDVNSIGVGEASWGLFLLGAVEYVAIISSSLLARSELVEQREGITEWPLHEVSICVLCLLTKHPIFSKCVELGAEEFDISVQDAC